jgi:putative endonuclease
MSMNQQKHHLYILVCHDDTLYTGTTDNLSETLEDHKAGLTPYVASRLPCCLIYTETHQSKWEAYKRENKIRRMSQSQKLQLIRKAMDEAREHA